MIDGRWMSIDSFFEDLDRDDWADRERDRHVLGEAQIEMERESRDVPQDGERR